ncbi:hypothetical protein T02_3336 [Trichinella nativa]|uniref:Uncharacterized protein n=3 Tax=Trichinella TaxID=6333 RepID=A0A0V1LJG7_9BILA|nr:hypothetical protein T02_3336 [Trichinella nativa]
MVFNLAFGRNVEMLINSQFLFNTFREMEELQQKNVKPKELTVLKPGRHRVATHVEGEERTCPLE